MAYLQPHRSSGGGGVTKYSKYADIIPTSLSKRPELCGEQSV